MRLWLGATKRQQLQIADAQAFYGERQQSDCGSRPRGRRGFGDSRGDRGRGNTNPRRYDLLPQFITRLVFDNCVNFEVGARLRSLADRN